MLAPNRENNYGYDPAEQQKATYTGMGFDVNAHDQWAIESQGRIQDRTREHLGQSTRRSPYRRMLRTQIETGFGGETPCSGVRCEQRPEMQGPATMDGIGPTQGWETFWMEVDVKRRRGAPWAAPVPKDIAPHVRHLTAAE